MNYDNPLNKRDLIGKQKVSVVATIISMILDVFLAGGKIICGVIFGAISVVADGLNNLTDSGSLIINLIGIKVSGMPADKEHPYGHARGEYIAAMAIAFLICFLAFNLLGDSIDQLIEKSSSEFSIITVVVLSVGIIVKLAMFIYNRMLGKKYDSEILLATGADSIGDVLASTAVLASLLIGRFAHVELDGYMGCLIAVIIALSGIKVLRRTISELMGKRPSPQLIEEIRRKLLSYQGIYGIHGLVVHSYVNKYYASVHVEIDADIPVLAAHELIDKIEKDFDQNTNVLLTIHLDPVILHDNETAQLSAKIEEMVKSIDRSFELHDFRLIKSAHPLLVFEICVPFETKLSDKEINDALFELLYGNFGIEYTYSVDIKRELTK